MKIFFRILFLSLLTGTAFVFFVRSNILQKAPGFRCESFGCMGLGIFYFCLALFVIPLVFGAVSFVCSREKRIKNMLLSVAISFVVMWMSLMANYIWNQIQIKRAMEAEDRAMRELFESLGIPQPLIEREMSMPVTQKK